MKKYIFSVLMAAMAAFTFSSCEDVPNLTHSLPSLMLQVLASLRVQVLLQIHSTLPVSLSISKMAVAQIRKFTPRVRWYQLRQAALMPVLVV